MVVVFGGTMDGGTVTAAVIAVALEIGRNCPSDATGTATGVGGGPVGNEGCCC